MAKKVIFWLVSPSTKFVRRLNAETAVQACKMRDSMRELIPDGTICTNECAHQFGNNLRFANGVFYEV